MKCFSRILFFLFFSLTLGAFGQKMNETNLSAGISKTSTPKGEIYWEEPTSPTYLFLGATKSWYRNDRSFTIKKEAGLNLQYANIRNSSGGLGAGNEYAGSIFSFFANASLQTLIRINSSFAFGIGPEAEILLVGKNNLNYSTYSMVDFPETTINSKHIVGINRDYFKQPSYGIKVSLFQTNINDKATIGLNFSYLWTKSELSDFYASNYTKINFFIGFRKDKKLLEQPTEEFPIAQ